MQRAGQVRWMMDLLGFFAIPTLKSSSQCAGRCHCQKREPQQQPNLLYNENFTNTTNQQIKTRLQFQTSQAATDKEESKVQQASRASLRIVEAKDFTNHGSKPKNKKRSKKYSRESQFRSPQVNFSPTSSGF